MLSILELNICVNFPFFSLHALTEDDISQESDCFSGLSNSKPCHFVRLRKTCQRNEQVALLLKVLKCDKSVIPSIYEFRSLLCFHAYLTLDEAENLSELEEVEEIGLPSMSKLASKAKRTRSRTSNGLLKAKKQKTSMGSILSQRRQNKEKWRYNEDFELELESDVKDLEEEESSEDDLLDDYGSSCRYEGYYGFDASGKRWYEVSLVDEKNQDYHKALLLDVLKWDSCKSSYWYKANHLFEARMSEEEADKVAGWLCTLSLQIRNEKLSSHSIELGCPGSDMSLGKRLEEVEYVEPRRYIVDLN
ncbi:hypothetical protein CXB51_036950 [Gossypium anomalum]|uniref:Uncharacterized protein n=1 Tax=Gossypium anomalum TaxID=47600 RepID=A0A8J5Y161_9ROSI|nr:hypothetical protein CXB51_036950 [Gossypium anomalum]